VEKNLTHEQLSELSFKLAKKLNRSVCIQVEYWAHKHLISSKKKNKDVDIRLSLVPGFDSEDCSNYDYKSFRELLDKCNILLKKEENENGN
jgi:hypothetical protein